MLYAYYVALSKDIAYSLKPPPSTQATRSHPGKAKSYEPKTLNETILTMRRKKVKDYTNFHPHFNQRERIGT